MSKRLGKKYIYLQSLFSVWCFIDFCLIEVMILSKKAPYRNIFVLFLSIFPVDCKNLVLFSLRASALLFPSGSGDQSTAVPQASEHLSLELHKEALEG